MAIKVPNTTSLTKRALIDKANTTTVVAAAVAAFLVVFSVVACRALLNQAGYQNRVISAKKQTLRTLNENLEARDDLVTAYKAFEGTSRNIIGGSTSDNTSDRDGDNAKIILDALPSKYDFPALTASLEKLSEMHSLDIESLVGTDDEVAQQSQQSSASPKPVPMDFELEVRGDYAQVQGLVRTFEKSIRPIQVHQLAITATDGAINATVNAQTFYQPEKKLELRTKVVR